VQKNHGCAIEGAGFSVADVQQTGIDLLECRERRFRGLRLRRTAQLGSSNADSRRHQETAAIAIDYFGHESLQFNPLEII
jgi:hypothetical protein